MTEEELYELRMEYREERMEDRRLANRSAEEILEDIEEWFQDNYADTLEQCYNKLRAELQDYGLDYQTDELFARCLDDCTGFIHPLTLDIAILRRIVKESQCLK